MTDADNTSEVCCLVLLAHGSPDPRWRAPFEDLERSLGEDLGRSKVKLAYMEFVSPTLLETAEAAREEGFSRLRILPLFMAGGGHVKRDIPVLAKKVEEELGLRVDLLPAVGEHQQVIEALRDIAREALD